MKSSFFSSFCPKDGSVLYKLIKVIYRDHFILCWNTGTWGYCHHWWKISECWEDSGEESGQHLKHPPKLQSLLQEAKGLCPRMPRAPGHTFAERVHVSSDECLSWKACLCSSLCSRFFTWIIHFVCSALRYLGIHTQKNGHVSLLFIF